MMERRHVLPALVTLLAGGCRRQKAEGFSGYAFVANQAGQAVAVVDLGAFAVARHIRVRGNPSMVVAHPSSAAVYALTPDTGLIHEIDPGSLTMLRSAGCGQSASQIMLSPDGETLWVICPASRALLGFSTRDLRPAGAVSLPERPVSFDISSDGAQAAVSLGESGLVAFCQLEEPQLERVAAAGGRAGLVRYRTDGGVVLVGDPAARMLSVLETAEGGLVVRLPLAVKPEHFAFDSTGGQLFVTGEGMDAVVIVHPYQTQVGSTILAGHAPGFVAASTEPAYLFVANPAAGDVTVLDLQTQRVVAVVAVGRRPDYVTFTPDGRYALVLNRQSGDMAVIRIASLSGRRRKFAPLFMMVPVGSEPVSAVVTTV